jgi:molybdopterin synthase sulfur carrier subunit
MPTVYIPSLMRKFSNNRARIELRLTQRTLTDLLSDLEESCPGIKRQIFDDAGVMKQYVNVFVNGHEVRCLDGVSTVVEDEDEVFIIPAMAGG